MEKLLYLPIENHDMKMHTFILLIILAGVSALFAQDKEIAKKQVKKVQVKPAMQYQYVLSHEDSIRIKQLLLDPPVSPRPLPIFDINPYHYPRPFNDVIIFDGPQSKEY